MDNNEDIDAASGPLNNEDRTCVRAPKRDGLGRIHGPKLKKLECEATGRVEEGEEEEEEAQEVEEGGKVKARCVLVRGLIDKKEEAVLVKSRRKTGL